MSGGRERMSEFFKRAHELVVESGVLALLVIGVWRLIQAEIKK